MAITVDYGQPPALAEQQAAKAIAELIPMKHEVVTLSPYVRAGETRSHREAMSVWWPFRNQLLLTLAAIRTAERGISEIYIGLVKGDIYKDCTHQFIEAMNRVFALQERRVKIIAPARNMTTIELLKRSKIPYAYLGITISCHVSDIPCGQCAGCLKSSKAKRMYKSIVEIPS